MNEKTINTRVIQKHDSAENWAKATNFIPKNGEIIVYDVDATHNKPRIKIGDGVTNVNALQFMSSVHVGPEDPGVDSGMLWIDTNDVRVMSAEGVEF